MRILNSLIFFAVLCCFGAAHLAAADTPPDPTIRFQALAERALLAMQAKAANVKIHGAAVIACIPGEQTRGWTSRMMVMDEFIIAKKSSNQKSNVLAIALTKLAEMADTLHDSGSNLREKYTGENGFQGGLIAPVPGGYMAAVFSGGYDLQVAQAGLEVLVHGDLPTP